MTTLASTVGPIGCGPNDLAEMIGLANSVMRQGGSQSFLTDYQLVYAAENLLNVQIIKTDGVIVSVVPFIPKQIDFAASAFGSASSRREPPARIIGASDMLAAVSMRASPSWRQQVSR